MPGPGSRRLQIRVILPFGKRLAEQTNRLGEFRMSIYVESRIHGSVDEIWRLTQTPELHARWDLRFSDIEYLPRPDPAQPQRFLYATRIGFGMTIRGEGETVGERQGDSGERTSALKFWSEDPRSLIREGAGYWRYVPTPDGVRFFTSYDYRVRFGVLGRWFDALVFRPIMHWATAWSFDRLRLWIEKGIDPALSLQLWLIHLVARVALAFIWVYHGAVPKLLARHVDELAMIEQSGISRELAPWIVIGVGWAEVVFGLALLVFFSQRWILGLTVVLMVLATLGVAMSSPAYLVAAFNPVSLNLAVIALAVVALLCGRDLPSARRCLLAQPGG